MARIRNWRLFAKLFFPLFLAILMPVVISSIINYKTSTNIMEHEVSQSDLYTLKQTREAVDEILSYTEKISTQLMANQLVKFLLNNQLSLTNLDDIHIIDQIDSTMQNNLVANPFVEQIGLYSSLNNLFISSESGIFRKLDEQETAANIQELALSNKDGIWLVAQDHPIFHGNDSSIHLLKFVFSFNNVVNGFIDIKLREEALLSFIDKMNIRQTGFLMITDLNGQAVIGRDTNEESFAATIQAATQANDEGYGKFKHDKRAYLLSFAKSKVYDWNYVAVVPADELKNLSYIFNRNLLWTGLIFAAVAFIVSVAVTRDMHNPIQSILLLLRGEVQLMRKRRNFLLHIDEFRHINAGIQNMAQAFSTEKDKRAQADIQIQRLLQRLDIDKEQITNYRIYQLLNGELREGADSPEQDVWLADLPQDKQYRVIAVRFHNPESLNQHQRSEWSELFAAVLDRYLIRLFFDRPDQAVLIVRVDDESKDSSDRLTEAMEAFRRKMLAERGWQTAMAVSKRRMGLTSIKDGYQDVLLMLTFMEMTDQFETIPAERFDLSAANPLNSYIRQKIEEIRPPSSESHKTSNRYIRAALRIIEHMYTEDISLTQLADQLEVTESYLSRLFKEEMGINFKDYLTRMKLEKAKKMLRETDEPIENIAHRVGYNYAVHFSRMFKKYEHLTAQEYRQLHR